MWKFALVLSLVVVAVFSQDCAECEESVKNVAGASKCVRKDGCCPAGINTMTCFIDPCQSSKAHRCVSNYCTDAPCAKYEYDNNLDRIRTQSPRMI